MCDGQLHWSSVSHNRTNLPVFHRSSNDCAATKRMLVPLILKISNWLANDFFSVVFLVPSVCLFVRCRLCYGDSHRTSSFVLCSRFASQGASWNVNGRRAVFHPNDLDSPKILLPLFSVPFCCCCWHERRARRVHGRTRMDLWILDSHKRLSEYSAEIHIHSNVMEAEKCNVKFSGPSTCRMDRRTLCNILYFISHDYITVKDSHAISE